MQAGLLAAVTAGPHGRINIWDTSEWKRQQTLEAGAEVVGMDMSDDFIAVGTSAGYVRIWRRLPGPEYQPLFEKDLQLDQAWPLYTVKLGEAPDGTPLMVVHSMGANALGVWKLVSVGRARWGHREG